MYWDELIAGAENVRLPRLTADPAAGDAAVRVTVPPAQADALRARAGELRTPVRTLVLAAHVAVVAYVCGTGDVLTGVHDGRAVPLRVRLDDDGSWADLVRDVAAAADASAPHRDLAPPMDFDVIFGDGDGDCPLRVGLAGGDALGLTLRYQGRELLAEQVDRLAGYHLRALELIAAEPGARRRPLMGPAEERLQRAFAGPVASLPEGTFVDVFDRRAARHPERVALRCGPAELTFAELDAASERLVASLARAGIRRGDVVTTMLPRGVAWAVGVLALFKLGAVYLPQDLEYPAQRITTVLRRGACRRVLTDAASAGRLARELPDVDVLVYEDAVAGPPAPSRCERPGPDDPAYIIFTSGSTGEPKGAVIRHSGMLNHLTAKVRDLRLGPDDRIAQLATQCFDISVWQLVVAWMCGGATTVYGRYDVLDVPAFLDALARDGITVLEVVPSYLDLLLRQVSLRPAALPALRFTMVTGEQLPPDLTTRWFARYPTVPLVNAYGPTEASDDVTHHLMDGPVTAARVPVGRPIVNTGIHVVGRDDALRPLGSFGEICVTGVGVGAGYVNDPDRTAAVFRPNRLDDRSPTLYRTGDVGRWLPGGVLDCAGRTDDQIKMRGYRIELSDIDAALALLPGVEAAVTVVGTRAGQPHLLSYFVGSAAPDLAEFKRELSRVLPAYMHPERVVRLDELPLTARGKVDRQALARREPPVPSTA